MKSSPTRIDSNPGRLQAEEMLHPAWQELMKLCARLGYGEIERLKVHDGLPVLAEITRQKVKLN
jgi:hypothetical protein